MGRLAPIDLGLGFWACVSLNIFTTSLFVSGLVVVYFRGCMLTWLL